MKIGDLRRRVVLQKRTVTEDTLWQQTENWTDYAYVWAAVEPLSGREYFAARQENAEITARIIIRYRNDVSPRDTRVLFRNRVFDVATVINPKEKNAFLILMCREVSV